MVKYSMEYLWNLQIFYGISKYSIEFLNIPWYIYGIFADFLWNIYGISKYSMEYLWNFFIFHGIFMEFSQIFYEILIKFSHNFHGIFTAFPWNI